LLKILSGVLPADAGEILLEGSAIQIRSAQDAMEAGIETVYQDLALVDTMTAYQNVYLGREELAANSVMRFFNFVDDRAMRVRARQVLDSLAVKVPSVNVTVKGMSGGQRQCLAIARALLWGRRIVILDEPTAALGVRETEQVLDVIRDLRKHDVSVIVVSHNMQQVMSVADRITVMRLGRTIATRTVNDTKVSEIVGLITGAIPGDTAAAETPA
jgi:ABC-type sugar transport system ATPase subunit